MFQCVVYGAAVSGLESYVLTQHQTRQLDTFLIAKRRALWQGGGCAKYSDVTYRARGNREVWQYIGMLPTQLELCVRRLSWLASMLRDVDSSTCLFTAAFGSLDFEEGSGVPRTNPWENCFFPI